MYISIYIAYFIMCCATGPYDIFSAVDLADQIPEVGRMCVAMQTHGAPCEQRQKTGASFSSSPLLIPMNAV